MKKILLALVAVSTAFLAGCSEPVPPAHLGKVLSPSGYAPDVHPPGRVNGFYPFSRNKLILLETGTGIVKEKVTVQLKDKVRLAFDVRFRTRIAGSDAIINAMFNDLTPEGNRVTLNQVYSTYGRMVVRNKSREIMNDYAVDEVHANYDRISNEIAAVLTEAFKHLPLAMSDVALGDIQWPEQVTAAVNATAQSRAEIAKIEADKAKEIADAEARLAVANANYDAEIREAETVRDYNKTIAAGISDKYLRFKALEVQKQMIEKMGTGNNNTVYMPYDALGTMGAQMQMFGK